MKLWTTSSGRAGGSSRAWTRSTTCFCGKEAVARELPTGRPLCKEHFIESIIKRAKEEVKGISGKVLLSVSGGKDSLVLMDVMAKIYDPSNLIA